MVAAVNSPKLTITELVFGNVMYEMGSFCTSIVASQADGTIIHGRIMDFDWTNFLRNIAYKAKFVRGDKHVYDGVLFAGTLGVLTGMKPGAFSISIN